MKRMADIFRGRIIDVSDNTYHRAHRRHAQARRFHPRARPGHIIETVRTGASGIGGNSGLCAILAHFSGGRL